MKRCLLVLCCLLAGGGRAAQAQQKRLALTIIPLPVKDIPPQTVDQVLAELAAELRRTYRASVLSGRSVGRAVWGELDSLAEQQARRAAKLVDDAFQAYKMLEPDKSLSLLEQAERALEAGGAELKDPEPLRKLHLTRGLVALGLGKQAEAQAAFGRAAAIDPAYQLPAEKFAPRIIQVYRSARQQLQATSPGRMRVVSKPDGASVTVDGKERGLTPLEVELYPGQHFLRLELPDHAPWTLNLPEGPCPPEIRARLVPQWAADPPAGLLAKAVADEQLDEAEVAVLRLLGGFFRSDAVLLVSLSQQQGSLYLGVRLFVLRPESVGSARLFNLGADPSRYPAKIRGVATTLEALRTLAPRALEIAPPPVTSAAPAPAPAPTEPLTGYEPVETTSPGRWYTSWWFWTIVGVAVAGAAAGTAVWLTLPESSWTLVVRPQ